MLKIISDVTETFVDATFNLIVIVSVILLYACILLTTNREIICFLNWIQMLENNVLISAIIDFVLSLSAVALLLSENKKFRKTWNTPSVLNSHTKVFSILLFQICFYLPYNNYVCTYVERINKKNMVPTYIEINSCIICEIFTIKIKMTIKLIK